MTTRIPLLAAAAGLIALGACTTTTDPYAPYGAPYGQPGVPGQGMPRAQQGAIAGAVVGGLYGLQRDRDGRNKLKDVAEGAVLGGVLGGLGGSILDAQAKALQADMTTPGVQVVNTGSSVNVTLPESVLFAFDSAALSGPAQSDLYAVARNLQQYPNSTIQVIGHTDARGTDAYNLDLSQRRARAVAGVLTAGGVSPNRIATIGRGKMQPVASNATEAGRAANRRVEIIITPLR